MFNAYYSLYLNLFDVIKLMVNKKRKKIINKKWYYVKLY